MRTNETNVYLDCPTTRAIYAIKMFNKGVVNVVHESIDQT